MREIGEVVLFDAGAYYAHNEMEWRALTLSDVRGREVCGGVLELYARPELQEGWDEENSLYGLKYNLNYSVGRPGSVTRETWVRLFVKALGEWRHADPLLWVVLSAICATCVSSMLRPLGLPRYDRDNHPAVTGARIAVHG